MSVTVTTQAELDAALAARESLVIINSPAGVWLTVRASDSSTVRAYGSSTVYASDSSTVYAYGSSTVRAYGSSTVHASDSSTVHAAAFVAVHLHHVAATVEGVHVIDVSAVDLKDAETWKAYTGADLLLDDDGRGYRLGHRSGRYFAGCRDFTAAEAIEHWSDTDHEAPESAALLLAAVQAHIASQVPR